jgi:hypothetical protein
MKILLMHVFIDLAEVLSSGRLRRGTSLDDSCLKFSGSVGIRSYATMFFLTVWFQRERCEALRSVAIVRHVFSHTMKSVAENDMKVKI